MASENRQKKTFKYLCEHCGYKTNRKWSFDYHINRKKPCKPKETESTNDEEYANCNENVTFVTPASEYVKIPDKPSSKGLTCPTCGVVFLNSQAKYRHMKKAQCKPPDDKVDKVEQLIENARLQEEEIDKLRREIEQLKYDFQMLKEINKNELPDNHKRNPGFSERMKKLITAEQGWKCNMCDVILPANYHVDHVLAICFGGTNHRTNGQALCVGCHKVKTQEENKMRLELQQNHKTKAECKKRKELKIADP